MDLIPASARLCNLMVINQAESESESVQCAGVTTLELGL